MKPDIHPKLFETKVSCACGENFTTAGTVKEIKVEICAKCHPFFTGRQKFVDTAGRVERFRAIFGQEVKPREKIKRHKPVPTKKVLSKPAEDGEPEAEDEAKAEAKGKAAPEADAKG